MKPGMTKAERQRNIRRYNKRLAKMQERDRNTPLPSLLSLVQDWTFLDLARATGLSKGSISNIMNGKRLPYLPSLVKIAKALGYWNPDGKLEKLAVAFLKLFQERHGITNIEEIGLGPGSAAAKHQVEQ